MRYKNFYIGIDGGGTRSRLAAADENMNIIGRAEGGSTNIAAETYEGVFCNIKNLFEKFLRETDVSLQNCQGICIGSAGASTGNNGKLLEQIFREIGYAGKLKIMNDAELVLLAETKGKPGVIIISGTGSAGYSINKKGKIFRAGGWGHLVDDGGSGYRIGMDAVKAALMDFDGRGKKTVLTSMVAEFASAEKPLPNSQERNGFSDLNLREMSEKITGYIYGNNFTKAKIAEIAMLVNSAANQGDRVAISIEQNAAEDLINLAAALIKRAELSSHKLILNGSIILRNENIRSIFENEIRKRFPAMNISEISLSAEVGAAFLAARL
jgi:N-acetylglucosamine kinase-like BadF-type ATPase